MQVLVINVLPLLSSCLDNMLGGERCENKQETMFITTRITLHKTQQHL